ncbi:hypothetical protein [Arthrobacter sp. SAFR-044]|uniref:hypothetical protein n=1 Tax=Arthrobacter sp. SAFR-044 TaxID=3387278 RepID=UPI003F7B5B7E
MLVLVILKPSLQETGQGAGGKNKGKYADWMEVFLIGRGHHAAVLSWGRMAEDVAIRRSFGCFIVLQSASCFKSKPVTGATSSGCCKKGECEGNKAVTRLPRASGAGAGEGVRKTANVNS